MEKTVLKGHNLIKKKKQQHTIVGIKKKRKTLNSESDSRAPKSNVNVEAI